MLLCSNARLRNVSKTYDYELYWIEFIERIFQFRIHNKEFWSGIDINGLLKFFLMEQVNRVFERSSDNELFP